MRPTFIIAAAGATALLTIASSAWAQANRTFVSGHGSDTNPCSLAAPCRSFAQALTQTNPGGEITILDPAGYGSVTINKAVSIVNDGVGEAGVTTATAVDGIDISIGASDTVNLRGLTLVGGGVGNNGISFINLGALNVQNCVIRGFTNNGMNLLPSGNAAFNVSDTIVSNVGAAGVLIDPSGTGTVTGVFDHVQATGSGTFGLAVTGADSTGAVDVTIANSTASSNVNGIAGASTGGRANTQVMIVHTVIANNSTTGVYESGANSTTYLAKNAITGNGTAFATFFTGALFSFGDNDIKGNGSDGGAISLVATK